MRFKEIQELDVIFLSHLASVLFAVPGTKQIRWIGVNQYVWMVEPGNYFCSWTVFDLDASQSFRCLFYSLRCITPAFSSIGSLPALYIVLPSYFDLVGSEAVPHHQLGTEDHSPLETVSLRLVGLNRLVISLPGVWCPVNSVSKTLWISLDPVKQIDHITVQVIDCLDGASILGE